MVYAGIFPIESDDVQELKEALERLNLNDASLVWEPESSAALGFGFRCGFLGLLHMEIVQERLEREFNLALITTAPTVAYRVRLRTGEVIPVDNPERLPDPSAIEEIEEPRCTATILVRVPMSAPSWSSARTAWRVPQPGAQAGDRVALTYDLPWARSSTTSTTSSSRGAGATRRSTTS